MLIVLQALLVACLSKSSIDYVRSKIIVNVYIHILNDRVTERNEARKERAAVNAASRHTDKIGYVPRNKQAAAMNASGLTSAGMMGQGRNDPSQALDDESAAGLAKLREQDAEIDAGIDQISRTIDNLTNIAGAMKDEVIIA